MPPCNGCITDNQATNSGIHEPHCRIREVIGVKIKGLDFSAG